MHAVTGQWPVDSKLGPDDLEHIASTVKHQAGFIHGYWGQNPDDPQIAYAFVVFTDEGAARAFADGVKGAIASASLSVIGVLADA